MFQERERLAQIEHKLDYLILITRKLVGMEYRMAADLSVITEAVTEETTVVQSAVVLLADLYEQLTAAANDPAAVQEIADSINANKQALADAIVANTPAA